MVLEEEGVFGGEWGRGCCLTGLPRGSSGLTESQLDPCMGIPVQTGTAGLGERGCAHPGILPRLQGAQRVLPRTPMNRPCRSAPHTLFAGPLRFLGKFVLRAGSLSPFPVPHSDVTCDEWSFYLLPLDEDIISMELPEFFRDYFLVSRTVSL